MTTLADAPSGVLRLHEKAAPGAHENYKTCLIRTVENRRTVACRPLSTVVKLVSWKETVCVTEGGKQTRDGSHQHLRFMS